MDRIQATAEIKARWKELYPADGSGRGKGIVCPICGSGSGKNGTGITEKPGSRNHFLKCWNGGCDFEGGSVIDLFMLEHNMNPDDRRDFSKAVDELAAELRITIDPPRRSSAAEDFSDTTTSSHRKPVEAPQTGGNPSFSGTAAPATEAATAPTQADYIAYYEQCMGNLAESEAAQAYLTGRGISLETCCNAIAEADNCCIGFDPAWVSPTAIKRLRARGSTWTPPGTPRIIIPVTESYYIARDIRPAIPEDERKFAKMNEGEPVVFNMGALYSGAEAVFVVEGAFDALSIIEAGQPAIALNSTSNVDKLIKTLEQQPTTATLILCLDNDPAGKKATDKLKEGLNRLNISYARADINGGHKDPNEALTADRAAFEQAIAKAVAGTAAKKPDNTTVYLDTIMGDDIARRQATGKKPTGLKNLDDVTGGGLRPGLFLIGAGTSIGKTTFCSQLADGLAENGSDVIYFSLEQSKLEMMAKSLSRETARISLGSAVTGTAIMDGYTPEIVLDAARRHKEKVGDRLSIVEAGFNADADFITDYVRRYVKRNGTRPVVFVDYLQILLPGTAGGKRIDKREAVEETLSKLVLLKRELDLTVIAIVSLNRNSYLYPFDFESIKETGLAEFSADVVWGLQLQCFDEPLFEEEKKLKEKRARVKAAKSEIPRKIKLVSLKHRGQQAIYDCNFTYYPQFDLFVPAAATTATSSPAGAQKRR